MQYQTLYFVMKKLFLSLILLLGTATAEQPAAATTDGLYIHQALSHYQKVIKNFIHCGETPMQSKIAITTPNAPAAIGTYSQAIVAGNTVYLSGQIPLVPTIMQIVDGGFEAQTKQVFDNLRTVCQAAHCDLNNIVKLTIYITDLKNFATLNDIMKTYFTEPYPARTTIPVKELPRGALIEIDAIAVVR